MISDTIKRLQDWYRGQCNGDWEHEYGILIETIDNPGWHVQIDISGTILEGKSIEPAKIETSETDWIDFKIKDQKFDGYGGVGNLEQLIEKFLAWAKAMS